MRKPSNWWRLTFGLVLLASVGLNIFACSYYRLPRPLWRWISEQRDPVPVIPLSVAAAPPRLTPALAFPHEQPPQEEALLEWQQKARAKLKERLGCSLAERSPEVRQVRVEKQGAVVRETLVLTMDDGVEAPAFLLRPEKAESKAGLLVIPGHSHGIVNTAGIVHDYQHGNALALAEAGYVVLTMEVRGFGYFGKVAMDHMAHVGLCLERGTTAQGVTVADASAALHYLAARPEVDGDRLGVVGFSSGGKAAIMLAALNPKVRAIVTSGAVHSFESTFSYSLQDPAVAVPGLSVWLDMSDCLGLLAPRPTLVHWGELDNNREARSAAFNPTSLTTFEQAQRIYRAAGATGLLEKSITPRLRHEFDNEAAIVFLHSRLPPDV